MSENEITMKVRELKQLSALIEEAEKEIETIRDQIKQQMYDLDVDELHAGEYKITWKESVSKRIDTTALKKSLPEIAQQFTKEIVSRPFCIR